MKRVIIASESDYFNVDDYSQDELLQMARDKTTSSDILMMLAKVINHDILYEVARNRNTPEEALRILAKDINWSVRDGVADNPATPEKIVRMLTKDKDSYVRQTAKLAIKQRQKAVKE